MQIFLFHRNAFQTNLFYPSIKNTPLPVNSRPGSNGNVGIHYTPLISRTGASPLDAVLCDTQDTPIFIGLTPLQGIQSAYYK